MSNPINLEVYADLTTRAHLPLFGFEYEGRWKGIPKGPHSCPPQSANRAFNFFRAAGYIPGIDMIIGIALLIFAAYTSSRGSNLSKEVLLRLAIRGCLTIAFGYWLVAADIAKYILQENALKSIPVKSLI